jgi:hypothetical protein
MCDDLTWHDPYTYILLDFLEKNNITNKNLFTRVNIKKTIMTIPYSIGENSAWKYFIENIKESEVSNELRSEFKKFFNQTKKKIEGDFFFKNSTDRMLLYAITKAFWSNECKIELEKSNVHLVYYKSQKKIIDLTIKIKNNKIRIVKKINLLDYENIDYENLIISVRANWIAVLDAECLRMIEDESKRSLYSIHDSILIDYLNIDELILWSNTVMSKNEFIDIKWDNKHNFKIFSFFIML